MRLQQQSSLAQEYTTEHWVSRPRLHTLYMVVVWNKCSLDYL